jgi:hypothetical protein
MHAWFQRASRSFDLTVTSYHDSVSDWAFGKISALQEISLVLKGGYGYYYMGEFGVDRVDFSRVS